MKVEYKRDLKDNYLILSALEEKEEDDYSIYMIEKNEIPGLLSLHRSRRDGNLLLNYEITGKQTLASLYERKQLGCTDILSILSEIGDVLDTLQKYLLPPENLIFDPQYIYLEPDGRKLCLCYAPGVKNEASIQMLAEFILRRLNHQDSGAVAAGYRFYGKTLEENFSLQRSLKELLLEYQGKAEDEKMPSYGSALQEPSRGQDRIQMPDQNSLRNGTRQYEGEKMQGKVGIQERNTLRNTRAYGEAVLYEEPEVIHKTRRKYQTAEKNETISERTKEAQESSVKKKSGKRDAVQQKKENRLVDRIFAIVHPAVLLSGLFLLAALEILFYFGYLQITETGGAFFLILSAELLINSFWKKSKEEKERARFESWDEEEEEEDEEYEELMQEMYPRTKAEEQPEEIGETRCLTDLKQEEELRLIPVRLPEEIDCVKGGIPDITIRQNSVTIGKMRQQCEAVVMAPAISRVHARLEYRQGAYYLKDLNSRNGTFLNGERLMPQEARVIEHGDRIAFADVQYRVVRV